MIDRIKNISRKTLHCFGCKIELGTIFFYISIFLFFVGCFFLRFHPAGNCLNTAFMGTPRADLYDEMWLDQACVQGLKEGRIITLNSRNFPESSNLLNGFISYGHVYFTALLTDFLPWPLWWNLSVMLAATSAAFAMFWAVKRFSSSNILGLFAGVFTIFSNPTFANFKEGFLPQLWTLPVTFAFVYLFETFYKDNNKSLKESKSWKLLTFWALIATSVFWLNSLFLVFAGILIILAKLPFITKSLIIKAVLSVGVCILAVSPFALAIIMTQPIMKEAITGQVSQESKQNIIDRSSTFSIHINLFASPENLDSFPMSKDGKRIKQVPFAQAIPFGILFIIALSVILEWRIKNGCAYLFAVSLLLLTLSLGPYIKYEECFIASTGSLIPVKMPFLMLQEAFPLLWRWSFPTRAIPSTMILFFLFCAHFSGIMNKRFSASKESKYLAKNTIIYYAVQCALVLSMYNAYSGLVSNYYHDPTTPLLPSSAPNYAIYLADKPEGVVADLPLGYVNNLYQNYAIHKQKMIQSQTIETPVFELSSPFLVYLHLFNSQTLLSAINSLPEIGTKTKADKKLMEDKLSLFRGTTFHSDDIPYGDRYPNRLRDEIIYTNIPEISNACHSSVDKIVDDYKKKYNLGLRYIALHRANCCWISPYYGGIIFENFKKMLNQILGKPCYSDYQTALYTLPKPEVFENNCHKLVHSANK